MTGLTETEHVVRGFMAGGIDYVTKPIDPEVVLARIAAHLRNARLVTQAQEAIDAAGLAVAVVSRDGRYLWLTPKAYRGLHNVLTDPPRAGENLPQGLRDWLQQEVDAVPGRESQAFPAGGSANRVAVHFLGGMTARTVPAPGRGGTARTAHLACRLAISSRDGRSRS